MKPWAADTECPYLDYQKFKGALDNASYHYADDSAKEWAKGDEYLWLAIEIAAANQWPYWALVRMIRESKCLVSLDHFMGSYLKYLYANMAEGSFW